jgi:hypothetical protein
MSKFLISICVIVLCAISFLLGTAFNTFNVASHTIEHFDKFTKMVIDPELQIRRNIDLYKRSINDPDSASKALRFHILTRYDWDNRCIGDYCEELNMNSPSYESNQVIIDFLNDFPIDGCKNLENTQRVECNLELVP